MGDSTPAPNTAHLPGSTPEENRQRIAEEKRAAVKRVTDRLDETGMHQRPRPPYQPAPVQLDADPTIVAGKFGRRGGDAA